MLRQEETLTCAYAYGRTETCEGAVKVRMSHDGRLYLRVVLCDRHYDALRRETIQLVARTFVPPTGEGGSDVHAA